MSLITSVAIGLYSLRRRSVAGATAFALAAFSQGFWTFGYIFELLNPGLDGKLFWDNLEFVGTVAWPFAFLAFAEQYSGHSLPGRRWFWPLLTALGVTYMALVFTDPFLHAVRRHPRLIPGDPFDELTYDFTWVTFIVFLPYTIATLGAFHLILKRLFDPHRIFRAQVLAVFLGALIPFAGIILTLSGVSFSFHRDTTPFTFAVSNVVMAFGLFFFRLFEIVPVGRDMVFDNLSDLVFVLNNDGVLVDVNPAAAAAIKRKPREILGRNITEIFSAWPDLVERIGSLDDDHREITLPDGRWFDIRVRTIRRPGASVSGRVFVVRNVTGDKKAEEILRQAHDELERKVRERTSQFVEINQELRRQIEDRRQAEKALRESEDRFKRLFELSAEAQFIGDETSTVVDCNKAFLELFALHDKSEVIGHTPYEFAAPVQPDGTPASEMGKKIISSVMQNGVAQFEWVHLKHDEKRTPVPTELILTIIPIQGRPLIHVTIRDITERKRLTEQLQQAQKMEAVGRLAGGVAHDFNNQLMVIMNVLEMMKRKMVEADPQRNLMELAQKAAEQSAGLTRQLLAFSRKQVLEPKVIQLNDVVDNLKKMLGRLIGEDIDLVFSPREPLPNIKVDPVQIEQVIINLAVNARDAMPDGGKLTIETGEADFDEEYCRSHPGVTPGRYVMLALSDNGVGMDAATQARIFEPFFTTKEMGKGTGLGLSMVYGIVQQCGGHIFVYSESGGGTCFKLYFPRAEEQTDAPRPSEDAVHLRGSETILLVEDNEPARETTRIILEHHRFRVISPVSTGEALRLFAENSDAIDLVITDVVMPGMSGRALAERLTAAKPGLKVLYVSGYTANVIAHHGILDKGINYLEKPFSADALIRKVRAVLDQ